MCVAATESVGWGGVKSLQPQAHRTAAPSHVKNREIVKGGSRGRRNGIGWLPENRMNNGLRTI